MLVIVDYGVGNLASVFNMFKKIGAKDVIVSGDKTIVEKANKILLPGVGAFDGGMGNLEKSGLIPLLHEKALNEKVPVLGICLGMQMLTRRSEEGLKPGLGWIDAETIKFKPDPGLKLKVPHMGWDYVTVRRDNPLLEKDSHSRFYFVHSYHVKCDTEEQSIATAKFDKEFTCMVNKGNIYGAQFHPEKSLKFGMNLLGNFLKL
jgi:glutamine amidotransferase